MAQWVSVNLALLVPDALKTMISTVDTLLTVVKTPLEIVAGVLKLVKSFLIALPSLNPVKILRGLVENFKSQFMGSGFYLCDMWDYPLRQLAPKTYGPEATYGQLDTNGGKFKDTFVTDLANSLVDPYDIKRPKFTSKCGMLVLSVGGGSIDDLRLFRDEGAIGETWSGMSQKLRGSALAANHIRYRGAFAKMIAAAELQPSDKTAARVERVQHAYKLLSQMDRDDVATLPIPTNSSSGEGFFEDMYPADIDWANDVDPVLTAVEEFSSQSKYPDWNRASLRDLWPELVVLIDTAFDAVLDLLQVGRTIVDQIVAIIDAISKKLEELQAIIDQIDQFLEQIEQFLNTTGFHGIWLTTSNGVTDLKSQLLASSGSVMSGKGYWAGMAIVAGGDAMSPLQMLFAPIVGG